MRGALDAVPRRLASALGSGPGRFLAVPVRVALHHEVIGVAGEAVERTLRAHGVREGGEPFVWAAVRGDDDGARPVAFEQQIVGIPALLGVERIEREVVEDEEVGREQCAEFGLIGVVEPRVLQRLEEAIGPDGERGVAAATGDVPERVREEGLPDADGPDDGDMGMRLEEAQRGEFLRATG